ncbi:MAG: preprotein translocase subunit YajC [Prevotella sp.]|jgi:preprotein translocase subunit YajC|nr:preprotein translocase subunit YajC [Prevotella sp.]MBQ2192443.1 preprotein translocase subunit YajC [Prevotella sp.]
MTQIILAAQQAAAPEGNIFTAILGNPLFLMVIIFVIFYFFMIKPQQKQRKEIQKFQNSLTEGTNVFTSGGIYGTVKKIDLANGIVEIEIAKGTVIRVNKNYVFKDDASTPVK